MSKNQIIILVVAWLAVLLVLKIQNPSDKELNIHTKDYCPNGDKSSSYYDNDCGIKPDEKICKWSDWKYYDKPDNAFCDWSQTPQWWTCNKWYIAKSEWDRKRDHTAWYCECKSSQVQCDLYNDTQIDSMQVEIDNQRVILHDMQVNRYSQTSVNRYNSQVQYINNLISKRNRYMSENCTCANN